MMISSGDLFIQEVMMKPTRSIQEVMYLGSIQEVMIYLFQEDDLFIYVTEEDYLCYMLLYVICFFVICFYNPPMS